MFRHEGLCPVYAPTPSAVAYLLLGIVGVRGGAYVAAMSLSAGNYKPRDAEHAVLYRVIDEHLDAFLETARRHADGTSLPAFVEQEFRDDKSGGFQLEDSRLTDPTSVSRLLLVMSVACLHLVSLGTFVVEREQQQSVDPHWLRGLSYFQIGWRWLRRALYLELPVGGLFRLSPRLDPAPVPLPRARRIIPIWIDWTPALAGP